MGWFLDNLVPEIIGIALTVFFVDRIIKWREDNRWSKTKNVVYSQFIRFMNRLTITLSPVCDSKLETYFYEFGKVRTGCTEFDEETKDIEIAKFVEENVNPRLKEMSIDHRIWLAKNLSKHIDDLDDLLTKTSHLIEPEILGGLLELRESLAYLEEVEGMLEFDKQASMSIGGVESFSNGVRRIFLSRDEIKRMLISISTGKYSLTIDGFLPAK